MSKELRVRVEDRVLKLSNVDKVLYPTPGFTKGEVIDYYTRVAPYILPHLAGRPLTVKRYPNGVDGKFFFEKNAPIHTPDWVRTVRLPAPGSTMDREEIDYIVVEGLPTLVWLANLAALEMHTPQWTVGPRGGARGTDLLVFDLDPGAPATITECREVACRLRDLLQADGLEGYPKTSGSKGMQVSVPIPETAPGRTSEYAKSLAERLAKEHPRDITAVMAKAQRKGMVFVDWSQNNPAKTTVCVYSIRARDQPTVSTPVTWDEVESAEELVFTTDDVLERVAELGDLHAGALEAGRGLPGR
ncbi:MAG TPA: non-homologous end-joining DNA ligase [Mycobacteriales bacterium]|nr:non-homologous end-joining DNA ligase [Mycobacteriales bacterium]